MGLFSKIRKAISHKRRYRAFSTGKGSAKRGFAAGQSIARSERKFGRTSKMRGLLG